MSHLQAYKAYSLLNDEITHINASLSTKAKCLLIVTQMRQSQNLDLPRSKRYLSKNSVHIRKVKKNLNGSTSDCYRRISKFIFQGCALVLQCTELIQLKER